MIAEQRFQQAAEKVKSGLSKRPSDNELLDLYGLFKQATVGDVDTPKPGALDLKGKYKWESWEKNKGMTKEQAMEKYISLVEELVAKYA
ncbi:acyl-CoA-binding protein homolog [Halyomorpha halys]|uniref:acyl-CoA-binding protein homolog n=1 Tax=Halyomorpha halys TaxID=286706 RepID=UPI0006D52076|nr:acyl-CoA-binding protein homolog [Halyomorpha halys]